MKPAQRMASIDIGTNTVLLLIADVDSSGKISTVHEEQRIIRLGKNVDAERNISEEGLDRCAAVLQTYKKIAEDYSCKKITACGTSALRDANNREWFLNEIKNKTGIFIEILSGNDEALWTYEGGRLVLRENPDDASEILVVDIGGGSTEFILGKKDAISRKISLDIGAVRLTEKFIQSDPAGASEATALSQYVAHLLKDRLHEFRVNDNNHAIGVAGTVTTLAAMEQKMERYRPDKINGYIITKDSLQKTLDELRPTTLTQRKSIQGLQPERADVIFAGAMILNEVMHYFRLPEITVSDYGLRYGLILRAVKNPR